MPLEPGTQLGIYEVLSLLGQGGMGEVYRARDGRLKRTVALKILPASFADDPHRVARFQREAELLASLNHPNIAGHDVDRISCASPPVPGARPESASAEHRDIRPPRRAQCLRTAVPRRHPPRLADHDGWRHVPAWAPSGRELFYVKLTAR